MASNDSEEEPETGGSLRAKLEASLTENRQLATELRSFKAAKEIADKGYRYVTAEDLKDVDLAGLSKKAAELEEVKGKERASVLRSVLAEQGVPEEDLDDEVSRFLAPKAESHAETSARLASLGRISGGFPDAHDDSNLSGPALIAAAINAKSSKSKR